MKAQAHNLSTVTCPLSGVRYSMAICYTSGKLHLSQLHPLITADLPPSQALKLGTEWLLWRGLHKLCTLGGLRCSKPVPAGYFGASIHKAVELVQELGSLSAWRSSYPQYVHSADTSAEGMLEWLESTWRAYAGVGSLSFQTQEERKLERSSSSKLDDALRVQAARKAAQGIRSSLLSVADTMLDIERTTGWTERHSNWLLATAHKSVPALSVLQLVKDKLLHNYPQAYFVGVKRTQDLEQVLQHLDTCMLQQAQELAQFAMSEEDEQQAASTIAGIQAQYAGLGLTSKIGYVVVPASSKVGDKNADGKMAKAIAARLQAALEQSSSIQAASTEPAPKLLPVDTSSHAVDCPCSFCKPLIGAPYNPADQAPAPAQATELTPMQRALAARAAQGAAK